MEKENLLWTYVLIWVMQLQAKVYGLTQLLFPNECLVAQVKIMGSSV